MGRAIDALITFRFLKLLVTPFNKTEAFKLGIIDENGKIEAVGKKVNKNNIPSREKYINLKKHKFQN